MRKRTGLHNRDRDGRGTYSIQQKSKDADRYGQWNKGERHGPETLNGHTVDWRPVSRSA